MADLAWFLGLFLLFCLSPGILIQPPFLARKKETFGYLSVHVRLTVLELASLEKKKKKKKKKEEERKCRFSIFSKFVFSASIKLSWNQRTYLYSGGSGLSIDIRPRA